MEAKEFILAHAEVPYDPVKRREYYLKNRKLKGRQPGAADTAARTVGGRSTEPPRQPKSNLKKTNAERVAALEGRLDRLKEVLAQLVKEAKTRSGVKEEPKSPSKTNASAGKGGSSKDSKLSAQEKREASKRSKEYREKHKNDAPTSDRQKAEEIQKKIKETLEKIKELKEQIAASKRAAQKRAQSKPGSVGARNSATTK